MDEIIEFAISITIPFIIKWALETFYKGLQTGDLDLLIPAGIVIWIFYRYWKKKKRF